MNITEISAVAEVTASKPVYRSGAIRINNGVKTNVNVKEMAAQTNFQDVLNQQLDSAQQLQFSKHANMRLMARDIKLSDEQLERVNNGVISAKAKGINDSLVLVDDVALVVNVRSKTVITAMPANSGESGKDNGAENVFTNIDGAVIV